MKQTFVLGSMSGIVALMLIYLASQSKILIASDTKFHYGDVVKVTSGFYAGCTGDIDDKLADRNIYRINTLTCTYGKKYYIDIESRLLEKLNE